MTVKKKTPGEVKKSSHTGRFVEKRSNINKKHYGKINKIIEEVSVADTIHPPKPQDDEGKVKA